MAPKPAEARKLWKCTDESALIRCAAGPGEVREEVWKDGDGRVVRYNLAFINHHLFAGDNGRVLGYDTAHGHVHRHFAGTVTPIAPVSYAVLLERFLAEVHELRRKTSL